MNKKEAKALTIEVWEEIVNEELIDKKDLSSEIWEKIENLKYECPLCEVFNDKTISDWVNNCSGCPLKEDKNQCFNETKDDDYYIWKSDNYDLEDRINAAADLLEIVKNWVIPDEE